MVNWLEVQGSMLRVMLRKLVSQAVRTRASATTTSLWTWNWEQGTYLETPGSGNQQILKTFASIVTYQTGHVEFCILPLHACIPLWASICICIHMHVFDQMRFAFPSVTSLRAWHDWPQSSTPILVLSWSCPDLWKCCGQVNYAF